MSTTPPSWYAARDIMRLVPVRRTGANGTYQADTQANAYHLLVSVRRLEQGARKVLEKENYTVILGVNQEPNSEYFGQTVPVSVSSGVGREKKLWTYGENLPMSDRVNAVADEAVRAVKQTSIAWPGFNSQTALF